MIRLLLFFTSLFIYANSYKINNYHFKSGCIQNNNILEVVLREFEYKNKKFYLVVNPNTLKTKIINYNLLFKCPLDIYKTRYYKLLNYSIINTKHPLQNDGITKAKSGIYLTTDLCPSSKRGFEKRLYHSIMNYFKNPVPVTIFITKKWIQKHYKEFSLLKKWQLENRLDITWGNHTANHIYHKGLALNKNFVLSKEEHLKKDILDLEIELIKNGVTPSVFFRFPGLISNIKSLRTVYNLGLITIGSNAWLAKGKMPINGSIILVHGNKNEPKGVDIFLKLLKSGYIKKLDSIKDFR